MIMNIGSIHWVAGSVVANAGAVAGVTTVWSNPFKMMAATTYGCAVLCQGSNPQIQIQLEESMFDLKLNGYGLNATNSLYVIPDAYPDVFSQISDNNWHLPPEPLTPIPAYHGRFKINGLTGNGSGVTVAIGLFIQEPGRFL